RRPDLAQAQAAAAAAQVPPPAAQASLPNEPPAAKSEAPAAAIQQPSAPPVPVSDPVKERVLALVVEKTGYPQDMLDLELDLEADLGVDTVKQAELLASVREIYNIP